MHVLGTVASSITGNLVNNFMTVFSSASTIITGLNNTIASNGDFYIASGGDGSVLAGGGKLSSSGNSIAWFKNKNLGQYSGYDGVAITSDGNPVFAGYNNQSGRKSGRAKFNATTGEQIWHYYYDITGYGNAATVDASDRIWSAQQTSGGAGVLRTDTNGLNPTYWNFSGATYCTRVQYLDDGNIYFLITGAPSLYRLNVISMTTGGTVNWQKEINTPYSTGGNIAKDNSGNIYVFTYAADSGTSGGRALVFKFNSSGTLLAQAQLDSNTSNFEGFSSCVFDTTNSYFYTVGSTAGKGLLVKYDTSLNVIWQRTFTGVDELYGISLVNSNNIFVTGTTNGKVFAAKVKTDGSGTGTYTILSQSITYGVSSLTASTPGFTASNAGFSPSSSTPSRTTATAIDQSPSISIERQVV